MTTLVVGAPVTNKSYTWNIPTNLAPGADYHFTLVTTGSQKLYAISKNFTITAGTSNIPQTPQQINPSINLTEPTLGQVVKLGSSMILNWTPTAVTDTQMILNLNKGTNYVGSYGGNLDVAKGTYTFSVPTTLAPGSDYYFWVGTFR